MCYLKVDKLYCGSRGHCCRDVRNGKFQMKIFNSLLSFPVICSIKMEVGIEDCLHIEFEYNKSK